MALLTTFSDTNKVITSIRADEVNKAFKWFPAYGGFVWVVETVQRQSYYYTGMNFATASACKTAMEGEWTKTVTDVSVSDSGELVVSTNTRLVASISLEPEGGNMWRCVVDVNFVLKTTEPYVAA